MHFYQRLKDIREDNDKNQGEIAEILGIKRQQYQLYESGRRELPMHHFIKLARYYNVSLDFLAGIETSPKPLIPYSDKKITEKERKILDEYQKNVHLQAAIDKLLNIE